ncbi:MAG: DUF302 domain-containing protein [Pseudolabrys sp.]|nr:DUF302 domain-containing protein [Pseudolabrys sp.]
MLRVLIAAMATFMTLSAATAGSVAPRNGWVVVNTAQSFSELSNRLETAVKTEKMGLVTSASASEGAKAAGITIPGNRVVGVFRNDFARRMLSASVAAGIEAPIRIYVTENPDGTSTLSYKKPSFAFGPYYGEGKDDLKGLAEELDVIFSKIVEMATK